MNTATSLSWKSVMDNTLVRIEKFRFEKIYYAIIFDTCEADLEQFFSN